MDCCPSWVRPPGGPGHESADTGPVALAPNSIRAQHGHEHRAVLVSRELFERVEHFQPWTPEVFVVASGDREPVASGGGGDVAVFDRHTLASFSEEPLLLRPHVGDRNVEPVDPPVHG